MLQKSEYLICEITSITSQISSKTLKFPDCISDHNLLHCCPETSIISNIWKMQMQVFKNHTRIAKSKTTLWLGYSNWYFLVLQLIFTIDFGTG